MFKFNFLESTDDQPNNSECKQTEWLQSEEVIPNEEFLLVDHLAQDSADHNVFKCGKDIKIKCVSTNSIIERLKDLSQQNSVIVADRNHSDLLTGVYEGGLKIWECTYNLADYICCNKIDLEDKEVLDLGCGAGIIGVLSLLKGSFCDFQDYNSDVIKYITVPNVYINVGDKLEGIKLSRCRFYAGDWQSFVEVTRNDGEDGKRYDLIFTSETIYNCENYQKLHSVFKEKLKPDGSVYLAAKTYYFGVGGGLRQFEDVLRKENVFDFQTCWRCAEGVQQEILLLKFKKDL